MTEINSEETYPNGNYPKRMTILVEEIPVWDASYTTDIVIAQRDFNFSDERKPWEVDYMIMEI
jgi:hypothetical protein